MRYILVGISLSLLLGPITTLQAQTRLDISISSYPSLILIPGYPVYYDPAQQLNYFFYGGRYWVFHEDGWYYSSWYNGPWIPMEADLVPVFIWRIPLRYYHHRPAYFQGRNANEAPPWDQHWGAGWSRKHPDWQLWNRQSVPAASPLPDYQKQYGGNRYPHSLKQQSTLEHQQARPHGDRHPPGLATPDAQPRPSPRPVPEPARHAAPAMPDNKHPMNADQPSRARSAEPPLRPGRPADGHAEPIRKPAGQAGAATAPDKLEHAMHPPRPPATDEPRHRPGAEP
jgi:hypothetical protein